MKIKNIIVSLLLVLSFTSCSNETSNNQENEKIYQAEELIPWINEIDTSSISFIMKYQTSQYNGIPFYTKYYYEEKEQILEMINQLKMPLKEVSIKKVQGGPSIDKMVINTENEKYIISTYGVGGPLYINGRYFQPVDPKYDSYFSYYYSRQVYGLPLSPSHNNVEYDIYKNGELFLENQKYIDDIDLVIYSKDVDLTFSDYYLIYQGKYQKYPTKVYLLPNNIVSVYSLIEGQRERFISNFRIVKNPPILE